MKKCFAMMLLLGAVCFGHLQAQEEQPVEKKGFDPSKLFFGGNFGLSFGDYTLVNVSPQVGYHFNKYFAAGAGVNFIYSSFKTRYFPSNTEAYRDNFGNTGVNVFARVYPIQFLLLQMQPELNYNWGKRKLADGTNLKLPGKFVPSVLAGAGGVLPAGRGAMIAMLQYDLVQDPRSPYGSKVFFTIGYNF